MAEIIEHYVINAESFWRPSYRLSPFNTSSIRDNVTIARNNHIDNAEIGSFFGDNFVFTNSGKQAISLALAALSLKKEDEVCILTTTGNKYISSCVTFEIEKFCNWSRTMTEKTKVIFVNHEFGFCYPDLQSLKQYNLPIIEDQALSFASNDLCRTTGTVGDFVIYSLPKFFPINVGGVLKCNNTNLISRIPTFDDRQQLEKYLAPLLSHYLKQVVAISTKRNSNYDYLTEEFRKLGLDARLQPSNLEIPGVFMFKAAHINLAGLKIFMQDNGVESSVFYGEDAFFLPVHQGLHKEDLDFFVTLVNYFTKNEGK